MQKQLNVKKLTAATNVAAVDVCRLLDENGVQFCPIDIADWEKDYPYKPDVKFRIAHSGDRIFIEYNVEEDSVRAVAQSDNGRVWEDSCCEFFVSPSSDNTYYNIETNCSGKVLIEHGAGRGNREHAPLDTVATVERWSSLGSEPFDEKQGRTAWKMCLVIPVSALFRDNIKSLDGTKMTANFYKCGDKQSKPHFLSWNKIETENPDFHRPEYFGKLSFE